MKITPRFWLALSLVMAGAAMRVVPHPWNFAPIGAIALFAGAHFDRRIFGLLVPLAAMFAADSILGYHALMPVIYATYALIAVIGMMLRDRRTSVIAVAGGTLSASLLFFMTTNFAVWIWSPLYTKNVAGLITCYLAAIPFFGNTLASDALFTAVLFGGFALMERRIPMFAPVTR